jgi:hypothetical protein
MTGEVLANSPLLYILIAIGLTAIVLFALFSFKKAKKRCLELGLSEETISNVVKATASSSLVPSLAILLGFLTLSVSMGAAWPWWRLSVIGSLSYEIMAADYTAKGIGVALSDLLTSDATVFASAMIVMTIGVVVGPIVVAFVAEKYSTGVMKAKTGKGDWGIVLSGVFYLAMFAVYIPILALTETATAMTLLTSFVLTILLGLAAKKLPWLNNFIMAIVLILAMASGVLWSSIF